MHRICGPFVLKTIIMNYFAFRETLMSCATRSLDLFILFKFIFLYLRYIPPHSCAFHTFCLHQFFSYVYYHAEYFSFLWWCRWSEKARNLILILAVKSLTWSMFYFLTFVVLNFHKIYVLTCSNLPTKLQAICCHFLIELKEPKHAKEHIKKDSNRYFVETFWKFWTKAKFKL